MNFFSRIFKKQKEAVKRDIRGEKQRLEAFLDAVAKLEEQFSCEIQAEIRVAPSAIVAIPKAVVKPLPQPTNDQPANPPAGSGTPPPEAGKSTEAPQTPAQA